MTTDVIGAPAARPVDRLLAPLRGLVLLLLFPFGLAASLVAVVLLAVGIGVPLSPLTFGAVRQLADLQRRLARRWCGVVIARPYRLPPGAEPEGWWARCGRVLSDPATWRDTLWGLVGGISANVLGVLALSLPLYGIFGIVMPFIWRPIAGDGNNWYTFVHVTDDGSALLAVPVGVALLVLGLAVGPALIRLHMFGARGLLRPTENAALALRVRQLADTRSAAVDSSAAELRRIERDLRDGAQARLVAMGMNLGAAERLLESDPAAARVLLGEIRGASEQALIELRGLVRGIHPPVLADRGLVDAVRAVCLDLSVPTEVTTDLPAGRFTPPVESAAYFAVSEVLANTVKHAGARRGHVDLRYAAGVLRVTVTDDGRGGADPAGGGLAGVARRLGAFDGTLVVHSPTGGPTVVTMEVPCASPSPKISSSSATG